MAGYRTGVLFPFASRTRAEKTATAAFCVCVGGDICICYSRGSRTRVLFCDNICFVQERAPIATLQILINLLSANNQTHFNFSGGEVAF